MFAYQMLDVNLFIFNFMFAKRVDTLVVIFNGKWGTSFLAFLMKANLYRIEVRIFVFDIRTTSLAVYLPWTSCKCLRRFFFCSCNHDYYSFPCNQGKCNVLLRSFFLYNHFSSKQRGGDAIKIFISVLYSFHSCGSYHFQFGTYGCFIFLSPFLPPIFTVSMHSILLIKYDITSNLPSLHLPNPMLASWLAT
jgi:hypothetical protein